MKTYYTLIAEDGAITLDTHFYRVQIGSNFLSHRALFMLSGYCSSKGYYFRKRTRGDDVFRMKIAESLGCKVYELPCMDAKAETLVSYLRKHAVLPWQPDSASNLRQLKEKTSPSFYLLCNTKCLKRGTF